MKRQDSDAIEDVSPYLRLPIRTFAEASRDLLRKRFLEWRRDAANDDRPVHVVPSARARSSAVGEGV